MSVDAGVTMFIGPNVNALLQFWSTRWGHVLRWDPRAQAAKELLPAIETALLGRAPVAVVSDEYWPSRRELDGMLPPGQHQLVATDHGYVGPRRDHRCAAMTAASIDADRWASVFLVCGTWWGVRDTPSVLVRDGFEADVLPGLGLPGSTHLQVERIEQIAQIDVERVTLSVEGSAVRDRLCRAFVGWGQRVQWLCARDGLDAFRPAPPATSHEITVRLAWVSRWSA